MATLAETRDSETEAHIKRTQLYIKTIALELITHHKYAAFLDEETIDLICNSAPLHDIG